jgi:hypothetical protein
MKNQIKSNQIKMEKGKVYSLIDFIKSTSIKSIIYDSYEIILAIVSENYQEWEKYRTRSGSRYINQITFDLGTKNIGFGIPLGLHDVENEVGIIVQELLNLAKLTINDSKLIPIQLFICYYRDGDDVCPMHKHKCRQITLSIGDDRNMTVGTKKVKLYNGSVIYLHTEKHGILKDESSKGNRLSFNLFYTTSDELDSVQ